MHDSAVLLIDCPDRRGLVARVSGLLYAHGANILHADQHRDEDLSLFFMRIEWALSSGDGEPAFDMSAFRREFEQLALEFHFRWKLALLREKTQVALFCSRYTHCLADLLHRWKNGELNCDIPLVLSNHRDAEPLARFYGVQFVHIPVGTEKRAAEEQQLHICRQHGIDLIVLARYMQVLSPEFIHHYPSRIINVHHSFLPAFSGARPYHAAHARGVKLIGATSHYATDVLDDGPIIEQDVARISHRDDVGDLVARGRDLERVVLSRAVRWHLEHRILTYGNKTVVFD